MITWNYDKQVSQVKEEVNVYTYPHLGKGEEVVGSMLEKYCIRPTFMILYLYDLCSPKERLNVHQSFILRMCLQLANADTETQWNS